MGINVLSLFDGMSCGQIALERAGIKVDNYFASEIDKYGQIVSKANYPNTIYLGDVRHINAKDLPKIDLIIGGSPCQSFSFAGKRKGMSTKDEQEILTLEHYLQLKSEGFEFEGQSYLFWEYMRLLNECNPKYFLLENVEMGEKWEKVLSKAIGVNGIHINSTLVSAQNRKRIYWTNIGMQPGGLFGDLVSIIEKPKDKGILLKDVLENEVDEKYFLSEKLIAGFERHKQRHDDKGTGFGYKPKTDLDKGNSLRANAALAPTDNILIVHNTMPRSSTSGKGGTGHLTRNDGKTYCLDTGNTNAVEIVAMRGRANENGINIQQLEHRDDNKTNCLTSVQKDNLVLGCDYRNDEGFRFRENGKSGTLAARARNDESCGQLAQINKSIRRLTPLECERLQTVPDNYTNHVSDSQRYKMLGNGWTVDVISHIFKYL
jgi:DNA (cytosine-5)-methyltransferase 3A